MEPQKIDNGRNTRRKTKTNMEKKGDAIRGKCRQFGDLLTKYGTSHTDLFSALLFILLEHLGKAVR